MARARGRTLVHFTPYTRVQRRFTRADRLGAAVAQHDLVECLLNHGVVDDLFFVDGSVPESNGRAAYEEFSARVGGSVEVGTLDRLRTLPEHADLILLDALPSMLKLARIRDLLSLRAPVIGLLHAVPGFSAHGMYHALQAELDASDAIVATSATGARALDVIFAHSRSLSTCPGPEIRLIPLPVLVDEMAGPDRACCREKLGWPLDATIVLWVGRFSEASKADLEPLVAAFAAMRTSGSTLLVCAGCDPEGYAQRVAAYAAQYGITDRFRLLADFPFADKPLVYGAADVFVSISENIQETFGLSLVEAMACGLPVIASDWSGYRDLVEHGSTGFLVRTFWPAHVSEYADLVWALNAGEGIVSRHILAQSTIICRDELKELLQRLVNDSELRAAFGRAGRGRVTELCRPASVAERYDALFRDKLAQAAKGTPPRALRLGDVFAAYASAPMPHGFIVPADGRLFDPNEWRDARAWADAHLRDGVRAILSQLRQHGSCEVPAQGTHVDAAIGRAAAWLVKRGYCCLSPAPPVAR